MWTSILAPVLIIVGVALLVLGSLPMENRLNGDTLTVKFIIGKRTIDMTDAKYLPVPDDVNHNLIRTNGTSVGSKKSGHFINKIFLITYLKIYLFTFSGQIKDIFVFGPGVHEMS